jgi:uncharacterized repeat protein (TIGR01451 family)
VSASASQVAPGATVTFHIVVNDLSGTPANHLHVTVTLPTGAVVDSASTDRGSGCVAGAAAGQLICDLDYLAGSPTVGNVFVVLTLPNDGQATLSASAKADQLEVNLANNTAAATVQVGSPPPPPPPPPTGPPAPLLKQVNARLLNGITRGTSEVVDGRFTTNEALHLTLTATRLNSARRLTLLKASRLAGVTTRTAATSVTRFAGQRGAYGFHAIFKHSVLAKGATYVLHITATNGAGKTTALAVRFRA